MHQQLTCTQIPIEEYEFYPPDEIHEFEEIGRESLELTSCTVQSIELQCQNCHLELPREAVDGLDISNKEDLLDIAFEVYENSYNDPREIDASLLLTLVSNFSVEEYPGVSPDITFRANELGIEDAQNNVTKRDKAEVISLLAEDNPE